MVKRPSEAFGLSQGRRQRRLFKAFARRGEGIGGGIRVCRVSRGSPVASTPAEMISPVCWWRCPPLTVELLGRGRTADKLPHDQATSFPTRPVDTSCGASPEIRPPRWIGERYEGCSQPRGPLPNPPVGGGPKHLLWSDGGPGLQTAAKTGSQRVAPTGVSPESPVQELVPGGGWPVLGATPTSIAPGHA